MADPQLTAAGSCLTRLISCHLRQCSQIVAPIPRGIHVLAVATRYPRLNMAGLAPEFPRACYPLMELLVMVHV
jgi:hypothetical protein